MAPTLSTVVNRASDGNLAKRIIDVTADAATITFASGLKVLQYAEYSLKSGVTTSLPRIYENLDASGAASNGNVAMTNCVANSVYRVTLYGGA